MIHQMFSLARGWSKQIIFPNFQTGRIAKNISSIIKLKVTIFLENHSLRRTENIRRKLSENISSISGDYCLPTSAILSSASEKAECTRLCFVIFCENQLQ